MAVAGPQDEERKLESQGSSFSRHDPDGLDLNVPLPLPKLSRPHLPPMATVLEKKPSVRQGQALPLAQLPQIVVPTPDPVSKGLLTPPARSPLSPLSPLLARARSKRRTIMERIEGWWDLGLLEKRQTLFANGSRRG
ncbi:hypothetical protein ACO1O0_004061 [Amphichorda felina]